MMITKEEGLRFNEDKDRWDLMHPKAQAGLARVLTKGAKKYAERNWEKGMSWSKVIASLKRHLAAIEKGEDYDLESGELHADHLQCNAHFLSAYYSIYPQGDDRQHQYLKHPRIGLDIDEVLCKWSQGWCERWDIEKQTAWVFDRNIFQRFEDMRSTGELNSFYSSLEVLTQPEDIPFEPHVYVTARPVDSHITEEWLDRNGFPHKPVITVECGTSKVQAIKESGCEVFIDDRFENFVELNNAGICTYLLTAPHNIRYNVGHKRINSLKDLPWFK